MVNAKVFPVKSDAARQARNFSHTRNVHSREIIQDYVEAIARLIEETGEARVVDLAKRLGVTHVTVNRTVGRLQKTGHVRSAPYRAIFLTDKGRQLAAACKARHETVVAFLRFLGIPDRVAEMDAEGIEHHVSPQTLTAFRSALRNGRRSKRAAESVRKARSLILPSGSPRFRECRTLDVSFNESRNRPYPQNAQFKSRFLYRAISFSPLLKPALSLALALQWERRSQSEQEQVKEQD